MTKRNFCYSAPKNAYIYVYTFIEQQRKENSLSHVSCGNSCSCVFEFELCNLLHFVL